MKTSKKIALCVAAVCVIAGAAMMFAALRMADGDLQNFATATFTQQTIRPEGTFTAVEIEAHSADVSIQPAQDGVCRAECTVCDGTRFDVQVDNAVLRVEFKDARTWMQRIGVRNDEQEVKLYLPAETYDSIRVQSSSGDVALAFVDVAGALDLRASSGDVSLSVSSAQQISAQTSSGDVGLSAVKAAEMLIQSSSGSLLVAKCGADTLDIQTSSGDQVLSSVTAKTEMRLHTSSGGISLNDCDAPSIDVETSSGDVTGNLRTDKVYDVQTGSGDVVTPPSAGDGKCTVRTSSGDVVFS